MVKRYHINPATGNPGLCKAQLRCRFGDMTSQHYETQEAARAAYEQEQSFRLAHPRARLLSDLTQPLVGLANPYQATAELYKETKAFFSKLERTEANALRNYAFTSSKEINMHLRGAKQIELETAEEWIKTTVVGLESAFAKAPVRERRVFRVESLRDGESQDAFLRRHTMGQAYDEKGYLSSTTSSDTALWLADRMRRKHETPVLLEIVTDRGAPLQSSEEPTSSRIQSLEDEVLLPKDSTYTVVAAHGRRKIEFGVDRPELAEYERHWGVLSKDFYKKDESLTLPSVQLLRTDGAP